MAEAFGRRCDAVFAFLHACSAAGQRLLEEAAEREAQLVFDPQCSKLDPTTDEVRRELFKLSCVKSLIEYYAGSDPCLLEAEHRRQLIHQTYADYYLMILLSDFPPPEINFPAEAAV